MFKTFRYRVLKKFYELLILDVISLDKSAVVGYKGLEVYSTTEVSTSAGSFKFMFKKDRRTKKRSGNYIPCVISYVVELVAPEGDECVKPTETATYIMGNFVVIIKVLLFRPDYEILTELFTDIYLEKVVREIYRKMSEP